MIYINNMQTALRPIRNHQIGNSEIKIYNYIYIYMLLYIYICCYINKISYIIFFNFKLFSMSHVHCLHEKPIIHLNLIDIIARMSN